MNPFLLSRFDDLERSLKLSGKFFFIDDSPQACDFAVFHHLDLSKELDNSLITKFPKLEKFMDDISSIDTVGSYFVKRPKLIDVSISPKLFIDGIAHPTGVNKT